MTLRQTKQILRLIDEFLDAAKFEIKEVPWCIFMHIYQPLRSGRSIFKRSLTGLNSEISFS